MQKRSELNMQFMQLPRESLQKIKFSVSQRDLRVCILESLNIIRLSFCNCISCVFISSVTLTATSSFQGLQHLAIFCSLSCKKIYGASNPRTELLRQHHDTHVHGFIY